MKSERPELKKNLKQRKSYKNPFEWIADRLIHMNTFAQITNGNQEMSEDYNELV